MREYLLPVLLTILTVAWATAAVILNCTDRIEDDEEPCCDPDCPHPAHPWNGEENDP